MNDLDQQTKTMETHLQVLVNACLKLQPKLTAIILYGSFGRDEGSWFKNTTDNWQPYNDYDLRIVSDRNIPVEKLKSLGKALAQEIGIKWIDLGQFHPDEMKRLRPSVLNYDFKYASKVIYGDSKVLDYIPEIDSGTLPMKEAQVLFFTRLYTLIGSLEESGFTATLKGDASRFFRNQMAKAILAVVDVLLLEKGAYDASYSMRVDRLHDLYPGKVELLELTRWALAEKLRPQAPEMSSKDVRELYQSTHKHFLSEMYLALAMHFGKSVTGPEDIEICLKWLPFSLMKRFYWCLKFHTLQMEKQISVLLAQSYIAAAWGSECINNIHLKQGINLLRKVNDCIAHDITWDQARLEAARLRMEG